MKIDYMNEIKMILKIPILFKNAMFVLLGKPSHGNFVYLQGSSAHRENQRSAVGETQTTLYYRVVGFFR